MFGYKKCSECGLVKFEKDYDQYCYSMLLRQQRDEETKEIINYLESENATLRRMLFENGNNKGGDGNKESPIFDK